METTPPKPKVMMEGYLNKKGAGTGIMGTGVGGMLSMFVGHLYLFNFIIYFAMYLHSLQRPDKLEETMVRT